MGYYNLNDECCFHSKFGAMIFRHTNPTSYKIYQDCLWVDFKTR